MHAGKLIIEISLLTLLPSLKGITVSRPSLFNREGPISVWQKGKKEQESIGKSGLLKKRYVQEAPPNAYKPLSHHHPNQTHHLGGSTFFEELTTR